MQGTTINVTLATLPAASSASGLEQLDRIAGGILDQDLLATITCYDVVAERHTSLLQRLDGGDQILDFQLDAVPAAGGRNLPVGHRLTSPASTWSIK